MWRYNRVKQKRDYERMKSQSATASAVYFKGGSALGRGTELPLALAQKIFSFLLLLTYHHGLYFKMTEKQLVQHSDSTGYRL